MVRTGYTVTVETSRRRYLFSDKATSTKCFGAAATLKRDVLESGIDPGTHRPRTIPYHNVSDAVAPECWCVDIRAAYPTALLNMGAIRGTTFDKLAKMDKVDRLKAVGMLASRKFVQEFHNAHLERMYIDESPAAPYFYAACQAVGEVMEHVRHNTEGFLLYWVDGVFVDTPDPASIADTLSGMGYRTTTERVTCMRRSFDGRYYHYTKGGKSTYLCVPKRVEYRDAELIERLTNATPL